MQGCDREISYFKAIVCCIVDNKASQRFNTTQWPFGKDPKQEREEEIICGHVYYHSALSSLGCHSKHFKQKTCLVQEKKQTNKTNQVFTVPLWSANHVLDCV